MSRNPKQLIIAALAFVLLSLTAMTAVQVNADSGLALLVPDSGSTGFDVCQNRFIACGGLQACPSGCSCGPGFCVE